MLSRFANRYSAQVVRSLLLCLMLFFVPLLHSPSSAAQTAEDAATPSGISFDELEVYVDRFVQPYIGKTTNGASIAIVKDGKIILSKAYGYANSEYSIPAGPQTVFEFGSISKLFVWTSVMQLVENNKLDLQTDIRTYLPDDFLKRLTYEEPITLLHLMNHTAGFEEYMFDMAYTSPDRVRTLEEGLRIAEPAQVYRPGEHAAYSNYGNSLAAYIVEWAAGQPYDQYVNEHILAPANMKHTEIKSLLDDRPDLQMHKAAGYFSGSDGEFVESSWNYMSMYPNGGANGTADDLARFAMSFMPDADQSSPLFEKASTLPDMLSSSHSDHPDMPGIAHGFWEYAGAFRTLGHSGNTIAFSSSLQLVPEKRFAVVVLTNQAGETDLVNGLTQALIGSPNIPDADEILPESSRVTGSFAAARRADQGFMSLYPYLSLMHVTSEVPNRITVSLAGFKGEYRQLRPYLYQKMSGDAVLDFWPFLYFNMQNDEVQRISMYTTDYLPLPAGRSVPLLTAQAAAAVIALLFFLIVPPVHLLILLFRKRRKSPSAFNTLRIRTLAFQFSGTLLAVNNLLLAARMLAENERPYSDVLPQLILNAAFAGAGLIALILLLLQLKRSSNLARRSKINIAFSILLWLILIVLLIVWQFYR